MGLVPGEDLKQDALVLGADDLRRDAVDLGERAVEVLEVGDHDLVPQVELLQVGDQVLVGHRELAGQVRLDVQVLKSRLDRGRYPDDIGDGRGCCCGRGGDSIENFQQAQDRVGGGYLSYPGF